MSLLQTREVTMQFGGLTAVDQVSMQVEPGHIHALIGPNGAGKSTFINMISGIYKPTSGKILFDGEEAQGQGAANFSHRGVSRTFQNLRLFRNLSLIDNVVIGLHNQINQTLIGAMLRSRQARLVEREAVANAEEILRDVGLWERRFDEAKSLSYGQQKWLELVRALAAKPKLLLLDEPAAGLNTTESDKMEAFIRGLPSRGVTVLLIEHDMRLVMRLAERITVLNFGKVITEGTPEQIQNDPVVIEAYLGKGRNHAKAH
jgi:branched-chain amino acid transport system ATP-binding protein